MNVQFPDPLHFNSAIDVQGKRDVDVEDGVKR